MKEQELSKLSVLLSVLRKEILDHAGLEKRFSVKPQKIKYYRETLLPQIIEAEEILKNYDKQRADKDKRTTTKVV